MNLQAREKISTVFIKSLFLIFSHFPNTCPHPLCTEIFLNYLFHSYEQLFFVIHTHKLKLSTCPQFLLTSLRIVTTTISDFYCLSPKPCYYLFKIICYPHITSTCGQLLYRFGIPLFTI